MGIQIQGCGRQLHSSDAEKFDLILPMDRAVRDECISIFTEARGKANIQLFSQYCPGLDSPDVPDPYGGDESDFLFTLQIVYSGCKYLLDLHLKQQSGRTS